MERIANALESIAKSLRPKEQLRPFTDAELDSDERNNPIVRKDPKNWKGATFEGKRLSACPPEYLDAYAEIKEWIADKNEGDPAKEKFVRYDRLDAARARAWAARKRQPGWVEPEAKVPERRGVFANRAQQIPQDPEVYDGNENEEELDF